MNVRAAHETRNHDADIVTFLDPIDISINKTDAREAKDANARGPVSRKARAGLRATSGLPNRLRCGAVDRLVLGYLLLLESGGACPRVEHLELPRFHGHIKLTGKKGSEMESKAKKGGNGYPKPFKEQLVELYKTGSRASELAQELGCHESSIVDWAKQMERQAVGAGVDAGKPLNVNEREELIELRKRLRQVQMERDILAKATAWFAGKSEKTFIGSTG